LRRELSKRRGTRGGAANTPRRPVLVEELGASVGVPAPVRWLAFPVLEDGARASVQRITGSEALFGITRALLNLHVWNERALILARRIVEEAHAARVVGGTLGDIADALVEWASEDRP
jgi:hypothetical protein